MQLPSEKSVFTITSQFSSDAKAVSDEIINVNEEVAPEHIPVSPSSTAHQ